MFTCKEENVVPHHLWRGHEYRCENAPTQGKDTPWPETHSPSAPTASST
nr:MAG TPA: hypothetical protein [Caudoviricetes sp.]